MRGRHPKDAKVRQRRNKPPTSSAELSDETIVRKTPKLGKRADGHAWNREVLAWWKDLWDPESPYRERYLKLDVYVLRIVANEMHEYWSGAKGSRGKAELLRWMDAMGGTVLARRRLDWRIREALPDPVEAQPEAESEAATSGRGKRRERPDPRAALRVLEGGKG